MPRFEVTISGTVEIEADSEESITVHQVLSELNWADRPRAYIESCEELEDTKAKARGES